MTRDPPSPDIPDTRILCFIKKDLCMLDYLKIGGIISTHGLRGEVKVFPTTEDVRRYDDLDTVYIEMPLGRIEAHVERVRYFKNLVIVKFRGLDRIEDVEPYLKHDLYVSREDAIELEEGEYFVGDVIGLKVITDDGRVLGVLDDVMETGANDVYVIASAQEPGKEILLPVIRDVILETDLEEGYIKVHMLPGLE